MGNYIADDILMHYGMPRRSGRYPWGSGEHPYQHSSDFLARVEQMKRDGMSETEIAEYFKMPTTKLRVQVSLANDERRDLLVTRAKDLRDKGYSLRAIAKEMGYANDSSVRSLLNEHSESKMKEARNTADILKAEVDSKGMIDVGKGVERQLGVSREKLEEALYILEMDGYPTYKGRIPQVTDPNNQTTQKVLCPPGTEHKEIFDFDKVHHVDTNYIYDEDTDTFNRWVPQKPSSLDSSRMMIRYGDEGGSDKDGVIEIRRNVDDLSLGDSRYSQVRIMVDGTHYIKGMALYSDDMPPGVDVIFNTNKPSGTPMMGSKDNTVLKPIKTADPNNPFGALIRKDGQYEYVDISGNKKLSPINKTREEGDWNQWANELPAQFLSKQNMPLINRQLNMSIDDKMAELDEIRSLTNPTIKKHYLESFADDCDAAAVNLKAASLPRQKYQVILPVTSLKDTEVYAPNYKDGEQIALIRFPHGGTFEIPILTVNNKNREGRSILGTDTRDAVGINKNVADQLSGADFDGDTVMAIPLSGSFKINSKPKLKDLEGFDPKLEYGPSSYGDKKITKMTKSNTQKQMGIISNLITDMTLMGATDEELARAVRHSMVVIDAEKHELNYKQSYIDNDIESLKKQYQAKYNEETGRYNYGASTLISRAKSEQSVDKRQGSPRIDKETGELIFKTADPDKLYYTDKNGKVVKRTQKSTKMAETKDARELISKMNTKTEQAYAEYANKLKAMANEARKEMVSTKGSEYSASAKRLYSREVEALDKKLKLAELNSPKEREAQRIANVKINDLQKILIKEGYSKTEIKKELKKPRQLYLEEARKQVGARGKKIEITPKEWEAIQAGAITSNKLSSILNHADADKLREYAMPKGTGTMSQAKINRAKVYISMGYTQAQIAEALGVSVSTINKYINDKESA